jgi:hypothetical protein
MHISRRVLILATIGLAVAAFFALHERILHLQSSRMRAASAAYQLSEAIHRQDGKNTRGFMVAPPVFADHSQVEKGLLTLELLNNEVSAEGLDILANEGEFGPLNTLFPDQASAWLQPYGLSSDACVAFRLKRGQLTAELVLHRQPNGSYKVIRANDIRQLAEPAPTP